MKLNLLKKIYKSSFNFILCISFFFFNHEIREHFIYEHLILNDFKIKVKM